MSSGNSSNSSKPATAAASDERAEICRRLALGTTAQVYQIIAAGAHKAAELLLQRGLNAKTLLKLGYDAHGMQRLGYGEGALRSLGFGVGSATAGGAAHGAPATDRTDQSDRSDRSDPSDVLSGVSHAGSQPEAQHSMSSEELHVPGTARELRPLAADDLIVRDAGIAPELKVLLMRGYRAAELRDAGWNVMRCRKSGLPRSDMIRFGFNLSELAGACSARELRREGFGVRELKKYFSALDLKDAGFSASDMRLAGYGIRELLTLGYNENHIRVAGYSNAELMREGISRTVREL